jgi:hypothetical protein
MPWSTLSMIKAGRWDNSPEYFACAAMRALNGLCIVGWSRSLPPPQPGCPSGDPGPLPVPYSSTHVARVFASAYSRVFTQPLPLPVLILFDHVRFDLSQPGTKRFFLQLIRALSRVCSDPHCESPIFCKSSPMRASLRSSVRRGSILSSATDI